MINHLTRDVLHSVKIDCNTISGQLRIFVVGRDSYIYETGLRIHGTSWTVCLAGRPPAAPYILTLTLTLTLTGSLTPTLTGSLTPTPQADFEAN